MERPLAIFILLVSTLSTRLEGTTTRNQACEKLCEGRRQSSGDNLVAEAVPSTWARTYHDDYSREGLQGRVDDDGDIIPAPPPAGEPRPSGPLPIPPPPGEPPPTPIDTGPTGGEVGGDGKLDVGGELNFNWDTQVGWNTTFYGNISGGREHESHIILDNGGFIKDKDWLKWGAGFESNPWIVSNVGFKGGLKFGNVGGKRKRRRRRDLGSVLDVKYP